MKKLVFAIQVFALMAMFPVYLVAELNHSSSAGLPGNAQPSVYKERPEKNNIQQVSIPGYQELSSSMIKMNPYYLYQ